jgi:hypothetical protein
MKANYHTKALIDALNNDATEIIDLLIDKPDIDWTYRDKNFHILIYIASHGPAAAVQKCLEQNYKFETCGLLNSITNASVNGKLENVKLLIENRHRFNDNSDKEIQHTIDGALRHAGENNHFELFDYLLSLGANPNDWWVLYWTTQKAKKPMYEHLMKVALKLPKSPSKKSVIELCEQKKYKRIDIELLKSL